MALHQWPDFLPAWQLSNLVVDSALSTIRSTLPGYVEQASLSDRHFEVINASLFLQGVQVPIGVFQGSCRLSC